MSRYTSATDADRQAMLAAIGVDSVDDLFADVPEGVRLGRALDLPAGKPEQEVFARLRALAAKNTSADDELSFLGAGMYDHYVPALIDSIIQRSEFLTPYTPYQPEISQGGLQVMFEYQTAISELTGLPVSNASVYDGPSAVAAAGWLAHTHTRKPKFLVSAGLHPHSRETLATTSAGWGTTIEEIPLSAGVTELGEVGDDVAAIFIAQPNFYGAIEDLEALAARKSGALLIVQCDPLTLGVLRPPGDFDVDIAVGEGQSLGNRLDFGGPSFGFFAAQEAYLRRMPGRIAGETTDVDGRRGFVLTLQTREQHIRREKATHNICTAQALNALAGMIYLAWLGREGIVELGELLVARTHYARETLTALPGISAWHEQPVVREFALQLDADVHAVIERCAAKGVNPGYPLEGNGLLVAITEQRSKADIDRLADVLGAAVAAEREVVPA
jgi:glycine dehydrogenase subunit 1